MILYIPILIAIIGVLAYSLATNPKVAEIGRISFFAGLLVALFELHTGNFLR